MMGQDIRDAIPKVCVLIFIAAVGFIAVHLLFGCAARQPGDLPAYCYSEELYTAKLVRCVDDAETLAQSKKCREAVDFTCGIRQTRAK